MMSPSRRRGNNRKRNPRPTWTTVVAHSGEVRGEIEFEGSLRANYRGGVMKRLKGSFSLERWSGKSTRYRIAYNGFNAASGEDVTGDIPLPLTTWNPECSKAISRHMMARVLLLVMNPSSTEEGLEQLQITIPVVNGGHRAAKTVFEAFMAADTELKSKGEMLVGCRR